jgi:cytochrome c peroxidase
MRIHQDVDHGSQTTPAIIPRSEVDADASGKVATFQPGGPTFTALNPFFQNLGTNGRTCFTCHQPQNGWTVSAASLRKRFDSSAGADPIFRLIDGATCPTDDVSSLAAKSQSYKLPAAPQLQFEVTSVDDPYHCTMLTTPTTGIVSIYRRPLPSANLGFLSTFMWDGREPSLASQSMDATLIHAQANAAPTPAQQAQMVAFETGVFGCSHDLSARGATGGPAALSVQKFFIGINDPLGMNPTGAPFDPNIFNLYKPWLTLRGGSDSDTEARKSIARGEEVFNTTKINITGVAGLNDDLNTPLIQGFCGTCHDAPNVGDHSVKAPLNIGIADAGGKSPPALDISGLPVFTLTCKQGPLVGNIYTVTDPGKALISGKCQDIGRLKGPILRGARCPRAILPQRVGSNPARRRETSMTSDSI